MEHLATIDLWPEIRRLAATAKRKMAAVAYVTRDAEVSFRSGDVLVVDASDQAIKSGATSATILRTAHKRGARVFNCPGLHAKLLLFDDVAVVGSANLSATSATNGKVEAALITDHRSIVRSVRSIIHQLACQATEVEERFLQRIGKIKVARKEQESLRKPGVRLNAKLPAPSLPKPRKPRPPKTLRTQHASGVDDLLRKYDVKLDDPQFRRNGADIKRALRGDGIILDNPRTLAFRDMRFVFTGRFYFGTQHECMKATRALGGIPVPHNKVTSAVDVLVVGAGGNVQYL